MFLKAIFDFIRKFFFLINILFALYSLLVYQLVFSANIQHWLAGFLTLSFPLVLLGNLFFVVVWTLGKSTKAFLSLIMIFMTYSIKDRTIKLGLKDEVSGYPDFSILTYNVMYVDHMNSEKPTASGTAMKGISETMETLSADIKCFQEFYNDTKVFELNMIKRLSKDNPFYVYMHSDKDNDQADGAIGLATFSKYHIIRKEEEYFKTNNNGLLSTDIVVKGDTIRVINVQLRSMGIRVNKMLDENKKLDKKETRTVLSQLKYGFKSRGLEVGLLESWIEKSPYPVLVVGDLNEIPYGYAYGKIRKLLNNSFEDAGQGFGFTYRKILGFLRIDNQFYNKERLKIIKFKTLREYPFSDHYPLYGEYELQSKIGL